MCWQSPDFEESTNITIGTTDKIYCAQLHTRVGTELYSTLCVYGTDIHLV